MASIHPVSEGEREKRPKANKKHLPNDWIDEQKNKQKK